MYLIECRKCGIEERRDYYNCRYCERCAKEIKRERNNLNSIRYSQRPEVKKKRKEYLKLYREENKEKLKTQTKLIYQKNKDLPNFRNKRREYAKIYKEINKEKLKIKNVEYRKKNHTIILEKQRVYCQKNPEKIKERKKNYYLKPNSKIKVREWNKQYKKRPKAREYAREHKREKIKNNKQYSIMFRLRNLVLFALKKYSKEGKIYSSKKYGIDYKLIIKHLNPFPENIRDYQIDHIRPLCSFNFINQDGSTNLEEVQKAFAPENHRWLLKEENLAKIKEDLKMSVRRNQNA